VVSESYSGYPTILTQSGPALFALPPETFLHTGHANDPTVGAEARSSDQGSRAGLIAAMRVSRLAADADVAVAIASRVSYLRHSRQGRRE
jgi:hypothetical protein